MSKKAEGNLSTTSGGSGLTKDEENRLSARIIKAELMGKFELAEKLKKELENARKSLVEKDSDEDEIPKDTVLLTRTDARTGLTLPFKKKLAKAGIDLEAIAAKRVRATVPEQSLQEMLEDEKMTSAEDQHLMFAKLSSRASASQKTNDDFTIDDIFASKKAPDPEKEAEKDRKRAIEAQKRTEQALADCTYCMDSPRFLRHLVIKAGSRSYLSLPPFKPLVTGHCWLVPAGHVTSSTQLDEDVIEEMKAFRRELVNVYEKNDQDVIFMETAMRLHNLSHMVVECVPLAKDLGSLAPMYFKKAILECESEWQQNKKLIEVKNGVSKALPKGFSYFAVEFGLDGGFAHVIEKEQGFASYFGLEIVAGMMEIDEPQRWRRPPRQNFEEQSAVVKLLKKRWKVEEWTL